MQSQGLQKFIQGRHILKIAQINNDNIGLQWDFNGLISNNLNYKHLFLCITFKQENIQYFKNMADIAFSLFKCGDIYSVRFIDSKKNCWAEKMKMGKMNYIYKKQQHQTQKDVTIYWAKFLQKNLEDIQKQTMPSMVCMLVDEKISPELIQKQIAKFRVKNKSRAFFFILNAKIVSTTIDFSKGICWSHIWALNNKEISNHYFKIIQSQACRFVQLVISCKDHDICVSSETWKQVSFNIIQKQFYFPLNLKYYDILDVTVIGHCPDKIKDSKKKVEKFMQLIEKTIDQIYKSGIQIFTMSVKYELLDGSTFYSEQQLKVPVTNNQKFRSLNEEKKIKNEYMLPWGLQVYNNPFYTISFIRLNFERLIEI